MSLLSRALPKHTKPAAAHIVFAAFFAIVLIPVLSTPFATDLPRGMFKELIFLAGYAYFVSWIGFLLLIPVFLLLTRFAFNGLIPTTMSGAILGPFAFAAFGALFFGMAKSDLYEPGFYIINGALGGGHALAFWLLLRLFLWLDQRQITKRDADQPPKTSL